MTGTPVSQPKKHGCLYYIVIGFIALVVIGFVIRGIGSIANPSGISSQTGTAVAIAKRTSPTLNQTATILALTPSATPTKTTIPTKTFTPGPTLTPTETYTPSPTNTPLPPTATLSPLEALKVSIAAILGKGNRDIPRLNNVEFDGDMLIVDFAIDDNLTEKLIIYGAKMDIVDILKAVHNNGFVYNSVLVAGRFSMQDKYGNASESQVIGLIYNKSSVDKINWDNFLTDNIYSIKDGGFVVPAFQP